ncbi:hypothetical protein ACRRTK_023479 [Alexandromys fortis]
MVAVDRLVTDSSHWTGFQFQPLPWYLPSALLVTHRPLWSPRQVSAASSMRVFLPVLLAALLGVEQGNVNLGYTLNKGCSEICPRENINVNLGVASVNSYCCQSSFCNISTAGLGLRASIPMLGLGLLLSLLALLQLEP